MPDLRKLGLWFCLGVLWTGCGGVSDPSSLLPSAIIWVAPHQKPDQKTVFSTIQEAIREAKGRWIRVVSGTYPEALEIPESSVIQIEGDSQQPVILVPPAGKPGVVVGAKAEMILRNLRIEGGLRGLIINPESRVSLQHVQINHAVGQGVFAQQAHVVLDRVSVQEIKNPTEEQFKTIGQAQGIRVEGGTLTVTHSTFTKTANRGINVLKGAIATIQSSSFTGIGDQSVAAIAFQEAQGIVQQVTMQQWKEGLFVLQSTVLMEHATLQHLQGNAILVSDQSWVQLRHNTITSAKQSGISVSNSGGVLTSNTIEQAQEYGIFLFQREATMQVQVLQNTIRDSWGAGIQIFNTPAWVSGNRISGSRKRPGEDDGHGIASLDTLDLHLADNEIKDVQGTGIFLLRSSGRLATNRVENNRESGVFVSDTPKGLYVGMTGNQIARNHIAGVLIHKSKVLLLENTVSSTVYETSEQSGSGVVVYGQSDAEIHKDLYEKNEQYGLLVAVNSKALVTDTTLRSNKNWGIFLDCGTSQLSEQNNKYEQNGQGDRNKCP